MPTLFRFLFVVALLVGLVWGGMYMLATLVKPASRQMVQTIPPARLNQ
jgi:phage shock protein PspC (stress-responsive transcriptional regulator)